MTVTIAIPPEEEKKLADKAAASGRDVTEYVHQLIKKDIDQPSFEEIFAPVHQAVQDSGMTETELDSLLQTAIDESRQERRAKKAS
jgi:hypothetical protein